MCVPENIIYTIYMQEPLGSERASDPLEVRLLMIWVLETELESSARAVCSLLNQLPGLHAYSSYATYCILEKL